MRRGRFWRYYWSRYRIPTQMPKIDGPAPVAAPQNMNSTKTNEFIDPIDDKFPVSIRGNMCRPDVPEDQYVDSWYVCTSMTHHMGDYKPWSASAPANAYRFRPYNEFGSKGREYVQYLREFSRFSPEKSKEKGSKGFPFREPYLTKMASPSSAPDHPSPATTLSRAVAQSHHSRVLSPLEVQRDVGRIEQPLPCAGKIEVNRSEFPFKWNTEDWYEYEVAKVRCKRFNFENKESEVTYCIILEGMWDHHVAKLADDVCMFLKDVGRSVVDEKLESVRKMLSDLDMNQNVDPELIKSFQCAKKGPFGSSDAYDPEEVANFLRAELQKLEEECVSVINRCNIPIPAATNIYDANVSWPYVEKLEPWVRLAEYWTSSSDTSFTELEMSTAHYEFRKYFRKVIVKMPFQSTAFEQRIYSMRHWLHRQTSAEFHTTFRRNVVHDASLFPTEHDPQNTPTHEHHRLFSFALDWSSTPVGFLSVEVVRSADTWASIAERLGCREEELRAANDNVREIAEGISLCIPGTATRRLTSTSHSTKLLPLAPPDGPAIRTWEEAANIIGCTVEELQQINSAAAVLYKTDDNEGHFDPSTTELVVPDTAATPTAQELFATTERVYRSDTFATIAQRLQCSEDDLRLANPEIADLHAEGVDTVSVPLSAQAPRRNTHPQLRSQVATDSILPRTIGEQHTTGLQTIPRFPPNAEKFPHEYHTPTSRFPVTPQEQDFQDNWMSYTAKYLDPQFGMKEEPVPIYNVNKLWPMEQVPGKVDQTPFEEDQTWLLHPIPVQQMSMHDPEKDLQDLPFVNHEQFPRSIEWTAP
eukprot:gene4148-2990_t